MDLDKYLNSILEEQALDKSELDALSGHRDEIESHLRDEFGSDPIIRYGGSKAKGTMIRESYDLDIVCYFPESDERSLKDIYSDTQKILEKKYSVDAKTSAIRVMSLGDEDFHIDVVPGRFIDDEQHDAFLYISSQDGERIQTNLKTHIDAVKGSGCINVIKILKLWSVRNKLFIRTFILELSALKALEDFKDIDDLSASFIRVLEFMRDELSDIQLVDPANTNNVISDLITESDKKIIKQNASDSLNLLDNDKITEEDLELIFNSASLSKSSFYPEKHHSPVMPRKEWRA